MTANQLLVGVRLMLGDTDKLKNSDYEMLIVLNSVLAMVYSALEDMDSYIIKKELPITMTNDTITLPSNFKSIISLTSGGNQVGYKMFGDKIITDLADTLTYISTFVSLESLADDIPLPNSFMEPIKKYMIMLLSGKSSYMDIASIIRAETTQGYKGNDYVYLERKMEFTL